MAAGGVKQWGVFCPYRIKMQAKGDHAPQYLHRRGDMDNTLFYGPGAEARHLQPLLHGNDAVLMPADSPVPGGRFIEQQGTNGHGAGTDQGCCGLPHGSIRCQKGRHRSDPTQAQARSIQREWRKVGPQLFYQRGSHKPGQMDGTVRMQIGHEDLNIPAR
ncbi:hypothetical protein GCM10011317_27410 [Niveispirillum cyanobacteriorum]|nr:hypothetical protein GCM10011317_27410 [Niveispirillum cyanobacteriorum]